MDSAWGSERQRVTLARAPQDCWTSRELVDLLERLSPFCEAKKSQVAVILRQNAATKASHVMKLIGRGEEHHIPLPKGKYPGGL